MPVGVGRTRISTENASSMGSTHAAHCDSDKMSSDCSLPLTQRHLLAGDLDVVRDAANDEADLHPANLLDLTWNHLLQT